MQASIFGAVRVQSQDKVGGLRQEGTWPKNGGDDGGGSLISPDGVAPSRIVGVSASVYLPLHHKVQKKISSGTGSPE